ncbi:LOW QUALITY PROTEIN: hypothetical protein CFOL_v3_31028, partial [Cephalotus follicularis]
FYDIKFKPNDIDKVRAKCVDGHTWMCYASQATKTDKTFQIKTYNSNHFCARTQKNRHLTYKFLRRFVEEVRTNPRWKIVDIQTKVKNKYHAYVYLMTVYRAKVLAIQIIDGIENNQYRLWDYIEELKRTNLGTSVHLQLQWPHIGAQPLFKRIYICLKACKDALVNTLRTVICLDGCHLKGLSRGIFLTAVDKAFPKCDMILNNLCECFNAAILEAKNKPIIIMVEMIKIYIMERIVKKKKNMIDYGGPICPKIQMKVE